MGTLSGIPAILFAVQWHRAILLQEAGTWRSVFSWSTPHSVFVSWSIVVQTVWLFPGLYEALWWSCASPLVLLAAAYAFARASLLLPAAAIGEPPSLSLAWARSSGNGWRLLGTYLLALVSCGMFFSPIWVPTLVVSYPQIVAARTMGPIAGLLFALPFYASEAVVVASLSLAFARLAGSSGQAVHGPVEGPVAHLEHRGE